MAKQYKATQPVGRFQKGDVVGGLDDAQSTDECDGNHKNLEGTYFFLQQVCGKQNGKEGTELIEHIGVCQIQTVDGIEIGDEADRTQNSPRNDESEISFADI